jgi:hypothetical protein
LKYCFRLTFSHPAPGFFRINEKSIPLGLDESHEFNLMARDSDTLAGAKYFHIEGHGFLDEATAKVSGERFRVRLRLLNALLALGIIIPIVDSKSGGVSPDIKKDLYEKTGHVALDTIVGLCVFPDDGKHFEYIMTGDIDVHPSNPDYVIDAIRNLWPIEMTLDDRTEDALNIVNISVTESSPRAKFLTAFLALERLIDKSSRSDAAKELLRSFQESVKYSTLKARDKASLIGALAMLNDESFSNALTRFSQRIKKPDKVGGFTVREFFSICINVRNMIAHNALLPPEIDLNMMANELRMMVLNLIWIKRGIPNVSVKIPPSLVSIPAGGLSFRVL